MIQFSANLGFLWTDRTLADRIRAAKAAGFDVVECHFPYDEPVHEIKAALSETNLSMLALNTRPGSAAAGDFGLAALPGREAEARAAIEEACTYAAAIAAPFVHVMAGKPEADPDVARGTYIANLAYATRLAEQNDQTILIEPINSRDAPGYFLSSVALAESVITDLGAPNLKIMFDCYHLQIIQGDLVNSFQSLLERELIGHIQFAAVPDRGEPDQGEINYSWLLPELQRRGYSGPFGAEYKPRNDMDAGLGWMTTLRT